MKIGLAITTYNSERLFSELYDSLPISKLDEVVVINGGDRYLKEYKDVDWIQHRKNQYPSVCRNDGLRFLQERDVDYFFILEDDQLILDENIFDAYIQAHEETKLGYFCFASNAWETGPPLARTPKLQVEYKDVKINFYQHFCNEFTFRTKKVLDESGYYKTNYRYIFDIQNVYDISKCINGSLFWYSPDIANSDQFIKNNPNSESRLNANGERDKKVQIEFEMFRQLNKIGVGDIKDLGRDALIQKLRNML